MRIDLNQWHSLNNALFNRKQMKYLEAFSIPQSPVKNFCYQEITDSMCTKYWCKRYFIQYTTIP